MEDHKDSIESIVVNNMLELIDHRFAELTILFRKTLESAVLVANNRQHSDFSAEIFVEAHQHKYASASMESLVYLRNRIERYIHLLVND